MKKREVLKYVLVVALVAALLFSTYLNININNSLQASLKNNRNAFSTALFNFHRSVDEATRIDEPNADNIEALIKDLWYEMFDSWMFLRVMEHLKPELSGYEKPLYFVDRFIKYTFLSGQSSTGGPNVRSVLNDLLGQAKYPPNSIPVTAFKELDQISFKKMRELAPISLILDIEQEYCSAEPVTFEAGLRNNAPFPVTLTFSCGCEILLWIEDENGNVFYPSGPREWEEGRRHPWGTDFSFAPFEEHRLKFNWTGEPGEYTLKVFTPWLYYRGHNYRVYINYTTTFTILP